ncbi:MAG TPA: hypothetical protein EYP90_06150 [Chromatiaceae bacterium]|nr:hypothetical protein [Chromatiaceae bacterium]
MVSRLVKKIAATAFVRSAIEERADLSAFKKKPGLRIILGLMAIGISYILGWPAVGLLGTLSVTMDQPLIVLIGGPLVYGLSHLVFLAGMVLAGAEYTWIFLRWATRVTVEKLLVRCG